MEKEEKTSSCKVYRQVASRPSETAWGFLMEMRKKTEAAPSITMVQDTTECDLILCGHTHGGQVTLFGIWAPYLTMKRSITGYGQRFMSGFSESKDGVPVYVSNGTGEFFPRVFARPQVIIFTFYADD